MMESQESGRTKSGKDLRKEQNEQEVLDTAIACARNGKKKTREILHMLSGETVPRGKKDAPDIIQIFKNEKDPENQMCIGVEHFMVDQASDIHKEKHISKSREYRGRIEKTVREGQKIKDSKDGLPDAFLARLNQNIFKMAAALNTYGYNDLLSAFQYSLEKHMNNIDIYRENIQAAANGLPIKLAFLIEIRCNMRELFLNNGRTVKQNENGLIPIFSGLVDLLRETESRDVDYIVMLIRNAANLSETRVIAFEARDILAELRKQNEVVYEYCGDSIRNSFEIEKLDEENKRIEYKVEPEDTDNYMQLIIPGFEKAFQCRKAGKPYATTRIVQVFMYSFGKDISFYTDSDGKRCIKCSQNKEGVLSRFDEFIEDHPIT